MTLETLEHEIVFGNSLNIAYEIRVKTDDNPEVIPDFTGFTAVSYWKRNINQTEADVIFSTQDGSIAALDDTGLVRLVKPQSVWQTLKPGKYFYNIDLTSPLGETSTYVIGIVNILPSTITV